MTNQMTSKRYAASSSAGGHAKRPFAVIDTHDVQGGRGYRRVSFHQTPQKAIAEAKRLNTQVNVAWPQKGGKVHRIDNSEHEGVVGTACGREVKVRTSAWEGEPPYQVRTIDHDRFMADIDSCYHCVAVAKAGR